VHERLRPWQLFNWLMQCFEDPDVHGVRLRDVSEQLEQRDGLQRVPDDLRGGQVHSAGVRCDCRHAVYRLPAGLFPGWQQQPNKLRDMRNRAVPGRGRPDELQGMHY
jgi:hypothetical protein